MPKAGLYVITKGSWASGFRLAGVDVLEVQSTAEAREKLKPFVEKNEPAMIAMDEELFPQDDKKLLKHLEEKPFPVILPLPKIEVETQEEQEKYVSELVRSCIGYYVKLK